jgi:hypothetical protein
MKPTLPVFTKAALAALALAAAPSSARAADLSQISSADFYAAAYYKEALEHPQIQKLKADKDKISAVAKDMKITPKKLKEALDKVEALGGDPAQLAVEAVQEALKGERVKGRVRDVLINTDEPKHVVLYIRWQADKAADVVKDASAIAYTVGAKAPLVSTLSLAAIHPKADPASKDSVWSGKIGHAQMARISPGRIEEYAERLYKNLFEGVEEKPF